MKWLTIDILLLIIMAYIFLAYNFLSQKEKRIRKKRFLLTNGLDDRFKIFEEFIIFISEKNIDYEQTFLKEIVQLRSQSQKFKKENDVRSEFFCEERISKISAKIIFLLENSTNLQNFEESKKFQDDILKHEENLLNLKNDYNKSIISFNRSKSSLFFILVSISIPKFQTKIELWNLH